MKKVLFVLFISLFSMNTFAFLSSSCEDTMINQINEAFSSDARKKIAKCMCKNKEFKGKNSSETYEEIIKMDEYVLNTKYGLKCVNEYFESLSCEEYMMEISLMVARTDQGESISDDVRDYKKFAKCFCKSEEFKDLNGRELKSYQLQNMWQRYEYGDKSKYYNKYNKSSVNIID